LFHGSTKRIEVYEISLSLNSLPCDFANGFYTTPYQDEAIEWALLKEPRAIVVNEYEWNYEAAQKLEIMFFELADIDWFEYVRYCRTENRRKQDFDIVVGPVADMRDIELMKNQVLPTSQLSTIVEQRASFKRASQVVFCSNRAVSTLKLVRDLPVDVFSEVMIDG